MRWAYAWAGGSVALYMNGSGPNNGCCQQACVAPGAYWISGVYPLKTGDNVVVAWVNTLFPQDEVFFDVGVTTDSAVPTRGSTWGSLKSVYR